LPDLEGSFDKGNVYLTWNCQYEGVKSIEVFRSNDSMHNYSLIGYVKKVKKGVQSFLDPHPVHGRSFYKLNIIFKSELNWSSNYIPIVVDKPAPATAAVTPPPPVDTVKPVIAPKPPKTEHPNTESAAFAKSEKKAVENIDAAVVKAGILPKVAPADTTTTVMPRKRIRISTDDPANRAPEIIKSKYIYSDQATGHIWLELPGDMRDFLYSVKFYNPQNRAVVEVPKVNALKIILDKRNFQKKGTYKFILRRDGLEFERGYVVVN
jgi:hypothetical protein